MASATPSNGLVVPSGAPSRPASQRTAGFSAQSCLEDPVGAATDCEQVLANVHHALGRNYQQIAYVSGLPGVSCGRSHAFHHWLAALDTRPFVFPGLVAGGPVAEVTYPDGPDGAQRISANFSDG